MDASLPLYVPALHCVQLKAPLALYEPPPHGTQNACPDEALNVPAAQLAQLEVVWLYFPALHGEQDDCPALTLTVPGAQEVQNDWPLFAL